MRKAILVLAACLFTIPLHGQAKKAAGPAPRDTQRRADLSGMWMRGGGGPPSEAPPYKPEALAKQDEFKKRQNADDPMGHCLLVGVPRIYSMPMPFKIVQLPTEVIFLHEAFRGIRIVPTDKQQHPEDAEPEYLGTSVGKWDGDTLVVDV